MKKKLKICIVKSQYNNTSKLLKSAVAELKKRKIFFKILQVPGAFEIPVVVVKNINKYDGFIAIGSIIKGKTPNFDFISSAITNGLMQISILYKKPIGNAVLTCLNEKQVKARSVKGFEAVIAVYDVLNAK
jgi:6,7-dimethyl-8-ribityllumazine synthase|tara:strand:+ start:1073 stop:1465 length:393 start_codon:yes stop_codon:yes gene_type:complete